MTAIKASQVKELRERTGLGMMECKKALVEAAGDIEKAIEDLRKSSGMKAAKKASRTAADGMVALKVADDGSYGVIAEVNSETDFVARDDSFQAFVATVLAKAFDGRLGDVADVMDEGMEVTRQALVQKIGENISVRRVELVTAPVVGGYVHNNNRIAVLVALQGGDAALAKDVAMHVAAVNPQVATPEDMPAELVAKEKEIYIAQARESGKPDEIVEKMVTGRVKKFLAESSLVEQAFVKDPDVKVGQLLTNAGAEIKGFVRFEVGEGIEIEEQDFAAEVAAQVGAQK
ncbi:MAG: elongation factor Ts [Gammaproteobacteria bacterium]|nr:MAG: elongation factor Ts [Gammaproteobacteria bacterium]RLA54658.1 MAG: elongation factor Ts [Gammaproteobacteria bacterium]